MPRKRRNAKVIDLTGNIAYNGEMLRKYRLKLDLSQEQLANELGISIRTLRDIESKGQGRKHNKLLEANIKAWLRETIWQERVSTKSIQKKGLHP